jgi:hypothetical protein
VLTNSFFSLKQKKGSLLNSGSLIESATITYINLNVVPVDKRMLSCIVM